MDLARLVAAGRDLLLAETCAGGCGTPAGTLCQSCAAALAPRPHRVEPLAAPTGFPTTFSGTWYEGPVRAALLAHKEQGRRALGRPLGALLAAAVDAATSGSGVPLEHWVLVPVPSRASAVRTRGHDSVRALAQHATEHLDGRVGVHAALRHARRVADQSALGLLERRANLDGALALRGCDRVGASVAVVDDLCSSGATLAAASRTVAAVPGVERVVAAVVASPRLRRRPSGY